MKAHTKDEQFMLALYAHAERLGDIFTPVDKYLVGQSCGLKERGVNATCVLLLQANFVKKGDDNTIYLTKRGEELALRLKEEGYSKD
jgi:hypothetical protein